MGILNIFSTPQKTPENKIKLVEELFSNVGNISNMAKAILAKVKTNKDLAEEVIKLCDDIKISQAYYYLGWAYSVKGAKFRPQIIEYYNLFLQNPTGLKPQGFYIRDGKHVYQKKEMILSNIYSDLGKAYEGEYDFDNALISFENAIKYDPAMPGNYVKAAEIYFKMNNLDAAIKLLNEAKKSSYYEPKKWKTPTGGEVFCDDTFKIVIDNYLKEYEDKKAKGYVYKPKKRKH